MHFFYNFLLVVQSNIFILPHPGQGLAGIRRFSILLHSTPKSNKKQARILYKLNLYTYLTAFSFLLE